MVQPGGLLVHQVVPGGAAAPGPALLDATSERPGRGNHHQSGEWLFFSPGTRAAVLLRLPWLLPLSPLERVLRTS